MDETAKHLVLEKLRNTLSYNELQQIEQQVDPSFVKTKLSRLEKRLRMGKVWLISSQLVMVAVIVTWGMQYGWESIWSYVLCAGFLGIGYVGIVQYVDKVREHAVWESVSFVLEHHEEGSESDLTSMTIHEGSL